MSFARIVPQFLLEAWIVGGVSDNRGRPRFRSTAELVDNDVCLATEGFVGNVSPRTVSSLIVMFPGCSVGLEDDASSIGVSSLLVTISALSTPLEKWFEIRCSSANWSDVKTPDFGSWVM